MTETHLHKTPLSGPGLRFTHLEELAANPNHGFSVFEIHPENYIDHHGRMAQLFKTVSQLTPILSHGLTLSIGGLDPLNWDYLKKLKQFLKDHEIPWFTDHLCFSSASAQQLHDLLPLPFTEEAAKHVAMRAKQVQDFLDVPLGLENISYYVSISEPEMSETDFIHEVLQRSGTSLLLDVNNIYVNSINHGSDAKKTLTALCDEPILHMHIAGHHQQSPDLIIDNHGDAVCDPVWDLLEHAANLRPLPTVIVERDMNIPSLDELKTEVLHAAKIVERSRQTAKHRQAS